MQREHGRLVQARTQGKELQSRGSQDVDLCQKYLADVLHAAQACSSHAGKHAGLGEGAAEQG